MKHANNKVQLGVAASRQKHHDNQGPVSLRLSHLQGVYVLWMIGLMGSTIAFVSELLWYRRQQTVLFYLDKEKTKTRNLLN